MVHSCYTFQVRHFWPLAPYSTGFPSQNVSQIVPLKLWHLGWSPSSHVAGFSQAFFWSGSLLTNFP